MLIECRQASSWHQEPRILSPSTPDYMLFAGLAQLVERNLAMVEVRSSSLLSRSTCNVWQHFFERSGSIFKQMLNLEVCQRGLLVLSRKQ